MRLNIALLGLFSFSVLAGNGSSGGGNIYGDQLNPWFLSNTKSVNYCVKIAPEFSELSHKEVLKRIYNALAYWKKTFATNETSFSFLFDTTLGKQDFVYQEKCDESTDLTFQFGSLTKPQKEKLNYKQIIGIAHRTSYDPVNLKGKGFIYIAPESGPLKPLSPKMHPTPWTTSKGKALEYLLYHELGHVWGLQDDHYASSALMNAFFAGILTEKETIQNFDKWIYSTNALGCNKDFEGFMKIGQGPGIELSSFQKFIGLSNKGFFVDIKVTARKMTITNYDGSPIGRIDLITTNSDSSFWKSAISLYLTKEQNVFTNVERQYYNNAFVIYGMRDSLILKDQLLMLSNGKKATVDVSFNTVCSAQLSGIFNGKFHYNLLRGKF